MSNAQEVIAAEYKPVYGFESHAIVSRSGDVIYTSDIEDLVVTARRYFMARFACAGLFTPKSRC